MSKLNELGLKNIEVTVQESIALVKMNRPKALNALNNDTLKELVSIFDVIKEEKGVLGVIVTGEGKGFVAGADITQMQNYKSEQGREYAEFAQSVFNKIENLEKPVIAAVNGAPCTSSWTGARRWRSSPTSAAPRARSILSCP